MQSINTRLQLRRLRWGMTAWRVVGSAAAAVLALAAIFVLAAWAESGPLPHAVQHLLIFSAGIGLGTVWTVRRPQKEDV